MMNQNSQSFAKTQIKGKIKKVERATLPKYNRPDSTWIAKGHRFKVEELYNNRLSYAQPAKISSIQWLCEVFPEAVYRILNGEIFTIDSFKKLRYYDYLVARLHPSANLDGVPSNSGLLHVWALFNDLVKLCHSVKKEGLTAPLDMYMDKKYPVLIRGHRRLEILHQLGRTNVPVRIWRTEWLARRFIPTKTWNKANGSIHGNAVKQFIKYGHKATDKYWVHGYTPYYDFHMRDKVSSHLRILELGIKDGMSLRLWSNSFPKSKIYGIDNKPTDSSKKLANNNRISIFNADIYKKGLLTAIAQEHGPFDMIIDDAIHRPKHQKFCYEALWKHLKHGGLYVIEDLHPNYREQHRGNSVMPVFTDNVDKIWTTHEVKSVSFYPNICFMEKA